MPLIEHQIRIRNRADSSDLLVITSVRGGTNPWIKEPPDGDGASFNPLTGESMCASYSVRVVDGITSGTDRVVTSKLEDVNQRLQLGFLKTYVESRRDGGAYTVLCAGYLTTLRLVDGIEWELQIQDASRVQGGVELFTAASTTTIASFLSSWPNRGCLFGGPIKGSFLTMPDWKGWTMRVKSFSFGGRTRYWLQPLNVYGPPHWNTSANRAEIAEHINDAAAAIASGVTEVTMGLMPFTTIGDTFARGIEFPGLVLLITYTDGSAVVHTDEPFRLIDPAGANNATGVDATFVREVVAARAYSTPCSVFALLDGQTALVDGSTVTIRCLTILPSEFSPIYIDAHPLDHWATANTAAGLAYNAAAVTTLKNLIGTGLRVSARITESKQMGMLNRELVYAPFGIGVRTNAAGELVPFSTRLFPATAPTKTITNALVVSNGAKVPFEQDITEGIARLLFTQRVVTLMADTPDGVLETDSEITVLNEDANALLSGTVTIDVPGMIRSDPSMIAPVGIDWLQGIAYQLFDRFGRGNQAFERDLIRGDGTTDADTANLGDEYLVSTSEIPNHNKRYGDDPSVGARAMQITRLTELLDRRQARFADSGPNAQIATAPTITIAGSSYAPRNIAEATITNAATLNAAGYRVRIQMAAVASGGSAPAADDYHDAYTSKLAAIPTTAIRLPAVIANKKVYVRARSESSTGRPSVWSSTANVTLTAIAPVTSLVAASVAGDGSQEDLTWVVGVTDCLVDVYVRASGAAFATAILKITLQPNSTAYRLEGLTPNTAYTASVQHRDPNTLDVSALTEATFTTANSTLTLNPPTNPIGFSSEVGALSAALGVGVGGFGNRTRTAAYGIAVLATELPSSVEVHEAVETGVGAGTYGSYAIASNGLVSSVSGDWTIWQGYAPNDKLRRKLKARHMRDGTTVSAFTTEVIVTPWTVAALPALQSLINPLTGVITPSVVTTDGRPVDSAGRFRCRAYLTASQSLTNDTEAALLFGAEEYDVGGLHSTSTNTNRITFPTGGNVGVWFIRGQIQFAANGTGDRLGILYYFNGSITVPLSTQVIPAVTWAIGGGWNLETTVTMTALIPAPAVGNYVYMSARQNSGGALNANVDFNLGGAVLANYGTYLEVFHLF